MDITLTHFLLLSLAAFRLANLLAEEHGPGDVLDKLRLRLGVRYDEYSNPYGTNNVSKLVLCPRCSSIWLGLILTLAYALIPYWTIYLSLPFAISAGAVIIKEAVDG